MAKTKAKKKQSSGKQSKGITFRFEDVKLQSLVLVVLGLLFYANTLPNGYAFDDGIVIQHNKYVQEGLGGIPGIFSTDVYESFYSQMDAEQQLSGGRYRPLSILTFALEQQLFGSKEQVKPENDVAFVRHFMNVFLSILSVVFLLQLLREYILPQSPHAAFLACLLFLCHPLHTEVIANVKSRDEILSFLFIVLTLIAVFRYRERKHPSLLACGLLFYFLALLSKEYAICLLGLIPLLLFVLKKATLARSIRAVVPFLAVALLYLLLRFSVVGVGSTQENLEVLNNPYIFATNPEKWATRIEILNRYLKLLVFPYPLSSDYSYNAIPYAHFSDVKVWWSIGLHVLLIAATIILAVRRNLFAFALAFYLAHLLLVSNFIVDIGATMGERLLYHSSFGFALALALLFDWAMRNVESGRRKTQMAIIVSVLLIIPCVAIVIPRNAQWKNDASLFIADAKTVPNSALANGNAGKAYIDLADRPENKAQAIELLTKSIPFFKKAISIHNGFFNGYLNLGVVYCKLGDFEGAEEAWKIAQQIYPDHPYLTTGRRWLGNAYYNQAKALGSEDASEAIRLLEKAVTADPENADLWYNLGEACFRVKEFIKARTAWTKALQLKPDYKEAERGMSSLPPQ